MILALDPSSTCTGYAVIDPAAQFLVEAGKLKGKASAGCIDRVLAMRVQLMDLLAEHRPDTVLVELPIEKQYTRTPGKRSGMAVWAGAAWALWMACYDWSMRNEEAVVMPKIVPVSNTDWTRGTDKVTRQAMVRAKFRRYEPKRDPGGDVSDAVAMALWWMAKPTGPAAAAWALGDGECP